MVRSDRFRGTAGWARVGGVALVAAALFVVAMAGPVSAAGSTITVSPSTVPAGASTTISGSIPTTGTASCPADEPVTFTSSQALFPQGGFGPTATRSTTGSFTVTYVVPRSTPAGTYAIGMRCGGGDVGVSASLTVISASARPVPGQPGFTG